MAKNKKPSQTALKVALNIVALGNVEKMESVLPKGIVDKTVQLLKNSNATSLRRIEKHLSPNIVGIYRKFDWFLPGQFEALGYRKAAFDKAVRESISNGVSQVLVLGSGFDTLCYRLSSEFPNVKFFEIDHPGTAIYKSEGIEKLGKAENHYILQEDLSKRDLSDVLDNHEKWDQHAKSIITAEGLLQYLPPKSVHDLFEQCSKITGNESRIAFTYIGKDENGKPDAGSRGKIMLWILKVYGEAWLWAANESELRKLLFTKNWKIAEESQIKKIGIEYFAIAEQI